MPAASASTFWDELPARFQLVLCDLWGVVHDGVRLKPGAEERLRQWRREGRFVVLITNAPRSAEAVERQLGHIGLPRQCWDAVVTAGDAGIEALRSLRSPVGFLGTQEDRAMLEAGGVLIAGEDENVAHMACAGFEAERPRPEQYISQLERWVRRGVVMHCLNPDRVVIRGGAPEPCAGALADLYEELGGDVIWYGKPYAEIYKRALEVAGHPSPDMVLAIGDGLSTDILGAARMDFQAVFIRTGVHAGEPFPEHFAASNGLGDWRPIASVEGLG